MPAFEKQIRETFRKSKAGLDKGRSLTLSVKLNGIEEFKVIFSKLDSFSPTYPEAHNIVEKSVYDARLVLEPCPAHGIPEFVGRLYEIEKASIQLLDNRKMERDFLYPETDLLEAHSNDLSAKEAKAMTMILYSTGIRLEELSKMNLGDIDLKHGRVRTG